MKNCVLFLPGRYDKRHFIFYLKLCRGKFKVAVDGGYVFFARAGIPADLLIGDFDSLKRRPRDLPEGTRVISFPVAKDKTDSHLAVEFCLESGARRIDIVQPTIGEPDHFTCNLLLPELAERYAAKGKRPDVRLVNPRYEVRFISNGRLVLDRARGDTVSVVPVSPGIVYSCSGTAFPADRVRVKRGSTLASRNRVTAQRAVFEVKGQALFFRLFHRLAGGGRAGGNVG